MASWKERHTVIPAVYLLLERDGKVLLMRRANTGYRDGYYSLPAGHLDGGEPARVAAARELAEEAGVIADPSTLEMVHVIHRQAEEGDHERIDFFFRVPGFTGEPKIAEPHKCDDLTWLAIDDLPDKTIPLVRKVLAEIKDGNVYSESDFTVDNDDEIV